MTDDVDYLSTGSAIERSLLCEASVALPHARYESPHTLRGTAIHGFLEACSKVGRDAALEQTDEEYRDICAELDLSGLHVQLSLAAEVSFAYNFVTDTARELGRGRGRVYDDVTRDELPCTLDVVGVHDVSRFVRRGLYTEFKSGWTTRRNISLVKQIDFGTLCVARAYGCDVVEGQHVNVHEGIAPYVQRRVIEGWEIDAFAAELREHAMRWRELRERFDASVMPRTFNTGAWCERCPAREWCSAQTNQLRWALAARDNFDGPMRVSLDSLDDEQVGRLYDDIEAAQSVLSMIKGRIIGLAASRRIRLGTTPDGLERWLGTVISEGNEKLDGEHVFDVVASLPDSMWRAPKEGEEPITGETVATKATRVTCTKKDLDAALKDAVPRGKKAEALRVIFDALKKIDGAITRKVNTDVKELRLRPAIDPQHVLEAAAAYSEPEPIDGGALVGSVDELEAHLSAEDAAALALLDSKLPQPDE